jgi:hypothetical protein
MRYGPGAYRKPPGGINWKWRGTGNGLSLPVWCGGTTSPAEPLVRPKRRRAPPPFQTADFSFDRRSIRGTTRKYRNRPYFVLKDTICALLAAKDHVNVYDGAIVPDPEGIITGGHDNKTARTVAIRQGETINGPALTAMFEQIIADNRTGGWRKLERQSRS